jgi:hypothetical protein
VAPSKNTLKLVELIRADDGSVEVLRLSERLDKDSRACDILAVLDALMVNTNCQALYIHEQPGLVADPQGRGVAKLVEVLKQGRIWALNIGETDLSLEGWECFADALIDTQVTHMFAELDMFPELKKRIRLEILRPNRLKHDRHKAIENRGVIQQIGQMWWNPNAGSHFKEALRRRREALSWSVIPESKLSAAQLAEAHDLSEELDAQWEQEELLGELSGGGGGGGGGEAAEGDSTKDVGGRSGSLGRQRRAPCGALMCSGALELAEELNRINALRRKCMLLLQQEGLLGSSRASGGGIGGGDVGGGSGKEVANGGEVEKKPPGVVPPVEASATT